jgi:hypothetical protein
MEDLMRRWLWLALVVIGCGSGVGPDGVIVGGDCDLSSQCAWGSRCIAGDRFPGGYCVKPCERDADCPGGSSCVEDQGGVCMLDCTGTPSCREGYQCSMVDGRGTLEPAQVCINP